MFTMYINHSFKELVAFSDYYLGKSTMATMLFFYLVEMVILITQCNKKLSTEDPSMFEDGF